MTRAQLCDVDSECVHGPKLSSLHVHSSLSLSLALCPKCVDPPAFSSFFHFQYFSKKTFFPTKRKRKKQGLRKRKNTKRKTMYRFLEKSSARLVSCARIKHLKCFAHGHTGHRIRHQPRRQTDRQGGVLPYHLSQGKQGYRARALGKKMRAVSLSLKSTRQRAVNFFFFSVAAKNDCT